MGEELKTVIGCCGEELRTVIGHCKEELKAVMGGLRTEVGVTEDINVGELMTVMGGMRFISCKFTHNHLRVIKAQQHHTAVHTAGVMTS